MTPPSSQDELAKSLRLQRAVIGRAECAVTRTLKVTPWEPRFMIISLHNVTDMRSFDISNDRLGVLHGLTQDMAFPPLPTRYPDDPERSNPPLNPRSPPHPLPHSSSENRGKSSHTTAMEDPEGTEKRSKSKFRFKKKHRSGRGEDEKRDSHHRHYHRHHHRRRHTHQDNEVTDDPAAYDDTYIPNAASFKYTNQDDAFRESLFDAMADDEGAAFWEGVYGQPINVYPRPELKDERGKLEMMDDEEYTKYVREKMWEKSHQHILEEREKREEERKKTKKRKRQEEENRKQWEQAEKTRVREDKRRREEKERARLRKRWDEYLEDWTIIMDGTRVDVKSSGEKGNRPQNLIPWPVESGELSDISREAVEQFFLSAPTDTESGSGDFTDILKLERVRWHPDKAQQRWGKDGIGEKELRGITAVFQVIDSLWIERRGKKA